MKKLTKMELEILIGALYHLDYGIEGDELRKKLQEELSKTNLKIIKQKIDYKLFDYTRTTP